MGWWKDSQNPEIELGDMPFDILHEAIKNFTHCYQEERGRKPSSSEIIRSLEEVLALFGDVYLSDLSETEITKLAVKMAKRKKKQVYEIGDYFAVPVTEEIYAFGRILQKDSNGYLVEIYESVSPDLHTPSQLKGYRRLFQPIYVGSNVWENWEWRILGGSTAYSTDNFEYPPFKMGDDVVGWHYWRGPNTKRTATPDEIATLESLRTWTGNSLKARVALATGCWGPPAIEERLKQGDALFDTGQYEEAISEWYIAQQYASYLPNDITISTLGQYAKKRIQETRTRKGTAAKN